MTVDDALYEMELVGHDFFLFQDKETDRPTVVYRRHAYDYGLIRLAWQVGRPGRPASPGAGLAWGGFARHLGWGHSNLQSTGNTCCRSCCALVKDARSNGSEGRRLRQYVVRRVEKAHRRRTEGQDRRVPRASRPVRS